MNLNVKIFNFKIGDLPLYSMAKNNKRVIPMRCCLYSPTNSKFFKFLITESYVYRAHFKDSNNF